MPGFLFCGGVNVGKNKWQDPYQQRCMKIIYADTAAEAETIVNCLFAEVATSGGDLPDVQVIPSGVGYTIVIFSYVWIE